MAADKPLRFKADGGLATKKLWLWREPGNEADLSESPYIDAMGINPERAYSRVEDFDEVSGTTLPAWLGVADTSAAGAPTLDFVDNAACGEYQLVTAADDEVETLTLYQADQLTIPITSKPVFQARWKIDMDTAPWSADERFVIGLAAARNATLDSNTVHAWFRIEGASLNLLWETDDGTTDTNDQDTGVDLVDNTYIEVRIDCSDLTAVRFYVLVAGEWKQVGSGNMAAATGNLQVYAEIQKDGGTETEDVRFDYIAFMCSRP